jgi:hypothetical protein
MNVRKEKFGKSVPLEVEAKGYLDGRPVLFRIWKKKTGQNKDKIAEIGVSVQREKATAHWDAEGAVFQGKKLFERKDKMPLKEKVSQLTQDEYGFTAIIDKDTDKKKEVDGTLIEFIYPLEFHVDDASGKALDDVKFTVTFSDGTVKQGVLKKGNAKLEDVPAGKFTLEVEGYHFVF